MRELIVAALAMENIEIYGFYSHFGRESAGVRYSQSTLTLSRRIVRFVWSRRRGRLPCRRSRLRVGRGSSRP